MMLWPIVALVCAATMILLMATARDADWVEWRHPPEKDDDGIREDDADDQSD